MNDALCSIRHAIVDVIRLRGAACLQALIIAGICFPILILLALKRGHVADLRAELLESPTARSVAVFSAFHGESRTLQELQHLPHDWAEVELAIPLLSNRVGRLRNSAGDIMPDVDLRATLPGDPVLTGFGLSIPESGELTIVPSESALESLNAGTGDLLDLEVSRDGEVWHAVPVRVAGSLPGDSDQSVAFLHAETLDRIIQFLRGGGVAEWDWPASADEAQPQYTRYLLIGQVSDPLSASDLDLLEGRQLAVERIDPSQHADVADLFLPESLASLEFRALSVRDAPKAVLGHAPEELSRLTESTDAVIPWPLPVLVCNSRGDDIEIRGTLLPERPRWLSAHTASQDLIQSPTTPTASLVRLRITDDSDDLGTLRFADGRGLDLPVLTSGSQTELQANEELVPPPPPLAEYIVPRTEEPLLYHADPALLAHLEEWQRGNLVFDAERCLFLPMSVSPTYSDFTLYAHSIDEIPALVRRLGDLGYSYHAQNARIEEIHAQDASLRFLVWIVAVSVFAFGTLTVVCVLFESTERKRGEIGILRVMGVSAQGIFLYVVTRGLLIGLIAGGFSTVAGWCAVQFMSWDPAAVHSTRWEWKPVISAIATGSDFMWIAVGCMASAGLGAIYPGCRASRLPPIDAVIEGKFR